MSQLLMPAEWERHEATWIAWPRNTSDWPGKFAPIPWVYAEIARKVVSGEILRILVNTARDEARAKRVLERVGIDLARMEFFRVPTNRGWTRDCGPIFARRLLPGETNELNVDGKHSKHNGTSGPARAAAENVIVDFAFNAWAKYPDWQLDNAVPGQVAGALDCPILAAEARGAEFVLEGGAVDVNGAGAALVTEECLLDASIQPRNPRLGRLDVEEALSRYLGATQVIWLGQGIAGDDTHGHIDDVCRFVGPRTVVLCQEDDPNDANYAPFHQNRERLEGARLVDGTKLEVVPLPMPSPLYFDGQRLPASYANFYIANAGVIVPTFNDPKDRVALGILADLFQDRPVAGIHATDLVWGLGTLHCLTQQQPSNPAKREGKD
ncbi:MAG TPA: agmatine deiminase family protein [Terriglobia bacterium]|nr:agmatine deiminase family protein [Terriglobia bacterium]